MEPRRALVPAGLLAATLAAGVGACGGQAPAPAATPPPAPASSAPWPEEADAGKREASKPDAAAASKDASAAPKSEPRLQRDPRPTITGSRAIETEVGTPGAILVLGGMATLRVPAEAFPEGATVRFAFAEDSFPGGPGRVGPAYELAPSVQSASGPFVLELPAQPKVAKPSFAVSRTVKRKSGDSLEWDFLAPTRVEADKQVVVLEIAELPGGWVHLSARAPKAK